MRSWLAATVASAVLSAAGHAAACGANPPAYWTLSGTLPAPDQLVPTDGVLLLIGKSWTEVYPDRGGEELSQTIDLSVRDAAGALVPGALEYWYFGPGAVVVWRPTAPLAPSASFTLESTTRQAVPRPAAAVGETSLRADFATGPDPAPPLRLSGELGVALETYRLDLWKNCNNCGTGCTANGSVRALRARITIPPVEGGFAPVGYAAWAWVKNDRHNLDGGKVLARLAPGVATEVLIDVRDQGEPFAPCVAVRVFDPAGNDVEPPVVCLPRLDVNQTICALDGAGSAGCPLSPIAAGGGDAATSAGCAISPTARGIHAAGPRTAALLLVAGVLAWIRRQRRRHSRRRRARFRDRAVA